MDSKWAEIRNLCLELALAELKKETAATVGTVRELVKIAIEIDMLNLQRSVQADTARRLKEVLTMKLLDVEGVKALLPIQNTKAYAIIRQLNEELREKGYMTIRGRVPEKYLIERFGLGEDTP